MYLSLACAVFAVLANTFLATNSDHRPQIFIDSIVFFFLVICIFLTAEKRGLTVFDIKLSKNERFLTIGIICIVLSIFFRAIVSVWTHSTQYFDCSSAGGSLYRIECILYASSIGNTSIRIAIPHIFAFAIAVACATITKNIGNRTKCLLLVAVASITIFGIEEALATFTWSHPLHHKLFGIQEDFSYTMMSGPFTNYGWTWPYIAPILAISLWFLARENTFKKRLTGFVLTTACAVIIFINSQRGGMLTFIGCVLIASFWILTINVFKKNLGRPSTSRFLSLLITALVISGSSVLLFIDDLNSLNTITSKIGLTLRKVPLSTSDARLQMWKFGVEMWKLNPLSGNGHGSWLWMSFEHAAKMSKPVIYDSAHNLYIQLLAELGAIHTFFILTIFFFIAKGVFKNLRNEKNGLLLFSLLLFSFLAATTVQEVDYIRTTYYQWAAVLGIVSANISPNAQQITAVRKGTTGVLVLLFFALVLVLYSISSTGIYGYEPRRKDQDWPAWERWVSKEATLVAKPGKYRSESFTTFPILMTHPFTSTNKYSENELPIIQGMVQGDYLFASIPSESLAFSKKSIRFSEGYPIDSRLVSGRIGYPAFRTNANLIWARNVTVKMNQGDLEVKCASEACYLLIGRCRATSEKPTMAFYGSSAAIITKINELPIDIDSSIDEITIGTGTHEHIDSRQEKYIWSPSLDFENSKSILIKIMSSQNIPTQLSNFGCLQRN